VSFGAVSQLAQRLSFVHLTDAAAAAVEWEECSETLEPAQSTNSKTVRFL